ncbi:MAG: membrane protein insertase YidC [Nitrospirae bacterium]|nr:membrane protein insertase YidC [Nitrospirota bacterium]
MEKRFILFLILSFALIISYPYFIEKTGVLKPINRQETIEKQTIEKREVRPESMGTSQRNPKTPPESMGEKTIQVNTALYHAVFTSRGAKLLRWELKNYTTADRKTRITLYERRPGATPAFSIQTPDADLNKQLDEELYAVEGQNLALDEQNKTGKITFLYHDPDTGRTLSKEFTFTNDDYRTGLDIETHAFPEWYSLSIGNDFGITDWGTARGFVGFIGPMTYINDELIKDNAAKLDQEVRHEGKIAWTALQDKYFIAAVISTEARAVTVSRSSPMNINSALEFKSSDPGPTVNHLLIYTGPKEHQRLKALGVKLEETVDFGWFIYGSWAIVRFIAKPLFHILQFLHGFTGNYGMAIILLTVGVKLLFVPLTHKSYRSMKDMQRLQPQLQALQKKHKDDKQRLQREMMELYQKNKVNPVGGCLPMLLQIPVFVALFNVLYTTIEIRQAPFILWIRDLSDKDPYFVLPIIMGLTMVIQQKMQPTTMDPTQAKIMLMMPVLMTFLFLSFPSGLVLYMITNNGLTIGQQYFTMKYFERPHEAGSGKASAAGREKA